MRHKIAMAAVVVLLALAGMTFTRAAAPAGTAAGAGQTKWEYKTLNHFHPAPNAKGQYIDDEGVAECNQLGAEGWEMVNAIPMGSGMQFYFKRPK